MKIRQPDIGFHSQLEINLRVLSTHPGESMHRLRTKVAFDRLLARIVSRKPVSFTLPREQINTRVKDLIDLLLLLKSKNFFFDAIPYTLSSVFLARNTHPLPIILPLPPQSWRKPFAKMAAECAICQSLDDGYKALVDFYTALQDRLYVQI